MIAMSFAAAAELRVCFFCARKAAKYRCPSCNAPYCGVDCFKSHDSRCTEAFYAEHVKQNFALLGRDLPVAERKQLLQLVASESDRRYDDSRAVLELASGDTRPGADSGTTTGCLTEAELLAEAFAELNAAPGSAPDPANSESAQTGRGDSLSSASREPAAAALQPGAIAPERLEELLMAAAPASRGRDRIAVSAAGDGGGDDGHRDEGSDDEDSSSSSSSSSAAAASGSGLTLSMLSAEERKHFLRSVASGELAEILPLDEWQPWWLQQHSASADTAASTAAEGESPDDAEVSTSAEPPICVARLAAPLPLLSSLIITRPPPGILFCNAVSILAAYAHVQRLYAGDWSGESALELARLMLSLTAVLSTDARFESPAQACDAFVAAASNPEVSLAGHRKDPSLTADASSVAAAAPGVRARSLALLPLRDAWSILHGGRDWTHRLDVGASAGGDAEPSMRLPGSEADPPSSGSSLRVLIAEAVELPPAVATAPGGTPSTSGARASRFVLPGRHYAVDALLHCRSVFEGAMAEAQADVHAARASAACQQNTPGAAAARQQNTPGAAAARVPASASASVSVPLRVMPRVLRQLEVASRKLHFFAVWAWDSGSGAASEPERAVIRGISDGELASACAALTAELRRREAADAAAGAASARSSMAAAAPRAVVLGL